MNHLRVEKMENKDKLEKSVAFVEKSESSSDDSKEEDKDEENGQKYEESSASSDGLQGGDSDEADMFDIS